MCTFQNRKKAFLLSCSSRRLFQRRPWDWERKTGKIRQIRANIFFFPSGDSGEHLVCAGNKKRKTDRGVHIFLPGFFCPSACYITPGQGVRGANNILPFFVCAKPYDVYAGHFNDGRRRVCVRWSTNGSPICTLPFSLGRRPLNF